MSKMDLEKFTLDVIGLGEEKEAVQAKKLCRTNEEIQQYSTPDSEREPERWKYILAHGTLDQCLMLLRTFPEVCDTFTKEELEEVCNAVIQNALSKLMRLADEPDDKVLPLDVITMVAEKGISPDPKLLTSSVIPSIVSTLKKQELPETVIESSARALTQILGLVSIDDQYLEREILTVTKSFTELDNIVIVREQAVKVLAGLFARFQHSSSSLSKEIVALLPPMAQDTEASVRQRVAEQIDYLLPRIESSDDRNTLLNELEQLVMDEDVAVKATALEASLKNWNNLTGHGASSLVKNEIATIAKKCEIQRNGILGSRDAGQGYSGECINSEFSAANPGRQHRSSTSSLAGEFATAVSVGIDGNLRVGNEREELMTISLAKMAARAFLIFSLETVDNEVVEALSRFLCSLTYHPATSVRLLAAKEAIICHFGLGSNETTHGKKLRPCLSRLSADPDADIREKLCLTVPVIMELRQEPDAESFFGGTMQKFMLDDSIEVQRHALLSCPQWVPRLGISNEVEETQRIRRKTLEMLWDKCTCDDMKHDQRVQASLAVVSREIPFLCDHSHATSFSLAVNLLLIAKGGVTIQKIACHSLVWMSRWASRSSVRQELNLLLTESFPSSKEHATRRLAVDALVAACWIFSPGYVVRNYFTILTEALQDHSVHVRLYALVAVPGILYHLNLGVEETLMKCFFAIYQCYCKPSCDREKELASSLICLLLDIPDVLEAAQQMWHSKDQAVLSCCSSFFSGSRVPTDAPEEKSMTSARSISSEDAPKEAAEEENDVTGFTSPREPYQQDTESKKLQGLRGGETSHSFRLRKGRSTLRRKGISIRPGSTPGKERRDSRSLKEDTNTYNTYESGSSKDLTESELDPLELPKIIPGAKVSVNRRITWKIKEGVLHYTWNECCLPSEKFSYYRRANCSCSKRRSPSHWENYNSLLEESAYSLRSSVLFVEQLLDSCQVSDACLCNPFALPSYAFTEDTIEGWKKAPQRVVSPSAVKWESLDPIFQTLRGYMSENGEVESGDENPFLEFFDRLSASHISSDMLLRTADMLKGEDRKRSQGLCGGLILSFPWAPVAEYEDLILSTHVTASGNPRSLYLMKDIANACPKCKKDKGELESDEKLIERGAAAESAAERSKFVSNRVKEAKKQRSRSVYGSSQGRAPSTSATSSSNVAKRNSTVRQSETNVSLPLGGRPKSDEFEWVRKKSSSQNDKFRRATITSATDNQPTREAAIDALYSPRSCKKSGANSRSPREEEAGKAKSSSLGTKVRSTAARVGSRIVGSKK
eukprot:gb/GECG01015431.1/.p1 GENE.gb/GECG01015431.1/~~gb/GECG01015431.1/.p1  ORF type:complete len:1288 (+),score=189.14 gb/GECG01015431.1/:1-3864(+)